MTLTDNGDGTVTSDIAWSVDNEPVDVPEFVNESIPNTGDLNRPLPYAFLLTGALLLMLGFVLFKRRHS